MKRFANVIFLIAAIAAFFVPIVLANGLKTTYAKALTDHECNSNEWHFVITQIDDESNAPGSIHVVWYGGYSEDVNRNAFTGKTAHYTTYSHLDVAVQSASAQIYNDWDGQFNLSHGPCGLPTPTPTPTGSPSSTPTGSGTPTGSPTGTPTGSPTSSPTESPSGTPPCEGRQCEETPTPTPTPTVTPTPTPGDVCENIEGIQTSVPEGKHLDASGKNCVEFSVPGAPESGGIGGGEVLGTSSVLGASTMADTGVGMDNLFYGIFTLGSLLSSLGIAKRGKQK